MTTQRPVSNKRKMMGEVAWEEYQRQRKNRKGKQYKLRNAELNCFRAAESRRKKKALLVLYKGGKCEVCGYDKDIPPSFVFHHLDQKDFTISSKHYGINKMKSEVDKCQLLCARCHAEIHYEMDMQAREQMAKNLDIDI